MEKSPQDESTVLMKRMVEINAFLMDLQFPGDVLMYRWSDSWCYTARGAKDVNNNEVVVIAHTTQDNSFSARAELYILWNGNCDSPLIKTARAAAKNYAKTHGFEEKTIDALLRRNKYWMGGLAWLISPGTEV